MKKLLFIVVFLCSFWVLGQTVTGKVTNQKKEPLIGASVHWQGTSIGVFTGEKGEFQISIKNRANKKLIANYIGFLHGTIELNQQTYVRFKLQDKKLLGELLVKGRRNGVIISDISPIKTEQITQTELGKSACCDLAGCFETQTTVQPQTTIFRDTLVPTITEQNFKTKFSQIMILMLPKQ